MSEFIKPEHECPFDPKQYHCDCFIAPVGSFSWALIQLKLRKRVTRSVWVNCQGNNEMYLAITPRVNNLAVEKDSAYAVDGIAVETKYDYLTHIDLRNEHGNFVPWQPTQEDMMACDWQFFKDNVKPEPVPDLGDNMMVFDLTMGTGIDKKNGSNTTWGYYDKKDDRKNSHGVLKLLQNKTDIEKTIIFYWIEYNNNNNNNNNDDPIFIWNLLSHHSKDSEKKTNELFENKSLYITVDDITYNLGKRSTTKATDIQYECVNWYQNNDEAKKLSAVLKRTGETKRFYCNWR
ncbi:DUF2829 domain-containing protein [Xenorhabdus stockiae]|uniref:DUF2829 domain-containing protein n=1 Tax=Xenorhabdus stockiae TaxID=351614 RepID=UPI003CF13984